jgi:hypothetical protein
MEVITYLVGNLAGAAYMAAISGGRATDERVKCLRIFADGNGEDNGEVCDGNCRYWACEDHDRTWLFTGGVFKALG